MEQHSQPFGCDNGKELSDDSGNESNLAVDSVHPRLSARYYVCVKCRGKFNCKKSLYLHFEGGCYRSCEKCGHKVYEKVHRGEALLRKCSDKCFPISVNEKV